MKGNKLVIIKGKGLTGLVLSKAYDEAVKKYGRKNVELWTLNEDYYNLSRKFKKLVTAHFDLHREHEHAARLVDDIVRYVHWKKPISNPIRDKNFPLLSVLTKTGMPAYFSCSVAYMVALAASRPSTAEICMVGCDFVGTERERGTEQNCVDFWLAYAIGKGVRVVYPLWHRLRKGELYE